MVAADPQRIAKLVQERLRQGLSPAARIRVLAEEVRRETSDGEWWYVPVSIHRDPENMAMYYQALSEVEEQLEEQEKIQVLLVPRIIPFERWKDIG